MAESKPEITFSDNKMTFEVVIKGETYAFNMTGGDIKFEQVIANPVPTDPPVDPTPEPQPEPEPPKPQPTPTDQPELGTIKTGAKWSTNPGKADTWKVLNMTDPKTEFKIVDAKGLNIMANIKTKEVAEALVTWFKGHEFPPKTENNPAPTPNPIDPNAKVDAQGITMIYAPKVGGDLITQNDTYQKESEHNTGPRTSLYAKSIYDVNSGEITEYFTMKLSDDKEQNAPKLMSGGHGSEPLEQGCCYAVGINQNGTLHLAKEWPKHPETPKFYDKIKYVDPNWKGLGNIKNKFVGMKIIYYPVEKDGKKGMHIEWWFDVNCLDTGKVENDWRQCAYADDFGDWKGEPLLENMGKKHGGKILGFYIRIDQKEEPVKFDKVGQHELAMPIKKLI